MSGKKTLIQEIEQAQLKTDVPEFGAGDTVTVQVKVKEGTRERLQAFQGVVIARRNRGLNSAFTVRKVSHGVGVERVFQLHSPIIDSIEVNRRGDVRRAKLYFLRDRIGKSRRLRDQRRGLRHVESWETAHADKVAASKKAAKEAAQKSDD